jgi:hypothetical protein
MLFHHIEMMIPGLALAVVLAPLTHDHWRHAFHALPSLEMTGLAGNMGSVRTIVYLHYSHWYVSP